MAFGSASPVLREEFEVFENKIPRFKGCTGYNESKI